MVAEGFGYFAGEGRLACSRWLLCVESDVGGVKGARLVRDIRRGSDAVYGRRKLVRIGRHVGRVSWKKFWVLGRALAEWSSMLKDKLVLVRMHNATAVAYANYGAWWSLRFTVPARSVEFRELSILRTSVALPIRGVDNGVADALSRSILRTGTCDADPERQIREKFQSMIVNKCGRMKT